MTDKVEVYCAECAKRFWMDRGLYEDICRDYKREGKEPCFHCGCILDGTEDTLLAEGKGF